MRDVEALVTLVPVLDGGGTGAGLVAPVVAGALAAVAAVCLGRAVGMLRLARRLDELHGSVSAWQIAHRARVRSIERRLTDIEVAVGHAEEVARVTGVELDRIRGPLLGRLEAVEPRLEIQILALQGRIPADHLDEWGEL